MLIDTNLLIYSVVGSTPPHAEARAWWETVLRGRTRIGIPWLNLAAFLRITTNPRVFPSPFKPSVAWAIVEDWLRSDLVWIPGPTARHAEVLGGLVRTYDVRADLVTDAQLAAIAIEHGLTIYSTDTDFGRFNEVRCVNPLA